MEAVLGYGNVGPYAGMPVMEGKATMFKMLGGSWAIAASPLATELKASP
jgi:malic enzyme